MNFCIPTEKTAHGLTTLSFPPPLISSLHRNYGERIRDDDSFSAWIPESGRGQKIVVRPGIRFRMCVFEAQRNSIQVITPLLNIEHIDSREGKSRYKPRPLNKGPPPLLVPWPKRSPPPEPQNNGPNRSPLPTRGCPRRQPQRRRTDDPGTRGTERAQEGPGGGGELGGSLGCGEGAGAAGRGAVWVVGGPKGTASRRRRTFGGTSGAIDRWGEAGGRGGCRAPTQREGGRGQ